MGQDKGASATPTGLSPTVEPVPVSPPDGASIPSANGPALWCAILAKMPEGSIIAGGAVRDYLLGVEPKDIDVFMSTDAPIEACEAAADDFAVHPADPRFGLFRIENDHERYEEYTAVSNIVCVSSGRIFDWRVDAVVIEHFTNGADLIEGFDFAITRCWFDGEIHDTPEAKRDRDRQCITLLSDEREERSLARFERLNARWGGGWRLERAAQAIEARRAETAKLAPSSDESAVAVGDAPEGLGQ